MHRKRVGAGIHPAGRFERGRRAVPLGNAIFEEDGSWCDAGRSLHQDHLAADSRTGAIPDIRRRDGLGQLV